MFFVIEEKLNMLTDSQLFDFMNNLAEPANLKDAKNKKYIASNKNNSLLFGIDNPSQLTNLSVEEIGLFGNEPWWQNYARVVSNLDEQVLCKKSIIYDERAIVVSNGIRFQKMIKMPILNNNNKVISIFTFSHNLTNTIKLEDLYEVYKKFYDKSIATRKFLNYLHIDYLFIEPPTQAELYILLAKTLIDNNKLLSLKLGISTRTIESHIIHLKYKIKNGDIHSVITKLRYKYVP
jgi:DNA-binding CsgD family transcriptional regulator